MEKQMDRQIFISYTFKRGGPFSESHVLLGISTTELMFFLKARSTRDMNPTE